MKICFGNIVYMLAFTLLSLQLQAQRRALQNQPYADNKLYHFGFHVGLHAQDLLLTNNGIAAENGEVWFAEIPAYSPGFSVGVIGDLFVNPYMNLRLTPTIHFGDKSVYFKEIQSEEEKRINVRSNYLSVPLDLKISSMRLNNSRPYVLAGIYGALDLGRKRGVPLLMNPVDYGFEFGMGCTFYMPFFRLAPEIKFKFGLPDAMNHTREDLANEPDKIYTKALSKATTRMVVITFNFE
ncbi:MAG: PorT family protein [Tannerella sp.]|nr:PorT family protein [Tannerella sp.]